MDTKRKILPKFKSPLSGALVGSLILHSILLVVYGLVLIPDHSNTPKPPKKFKIEMVKRKTSAPQQVRLKNTPVKKTERATPAKMVQSKAVSIKQTFQPTKVNKTKTSIVQKPRQAIQININQRTSPKYEMGKIRKVSLTEQQPLPKPRANIPVTPNHLGKIIKMYQKPVHSTPFHSKPKTLLASTEFEKRTRGAKTLHETSKPINVDLSRIEPRSVTLPRSNKSISKRHVSYQGKARLASMRVSSLKAIEPRVEAKVLSGKAMGVYESKARPVANLPSAQPLKVIPPFHINGSDTMRASLVQTETPSFLEVWPDPRPVPTIVDKRALDKYLSSLQVIIASTKKYPEAARKSGMEGKATIQFTLLKNGEVKDIQLISKTNYPILNKEAVNAIKRAAPFSRIPDEIGKSHLEIVLPFRFKLNE